MKINLGENTPEFGGNPPPILMVVTLTRKPGALVAPK